MSTTQKKNFFHGNIRICLHGDYAISNTNLLHDRMVMWIGSKDSGISIVDYRAKTLEIAHQISEKLASVNDFAKIFNLDGCITITTIGEEADRFEIQIRDVDPSLPVKNLLALGVIWDTLIPCYVTSWEKISFIHVRRQRGKKRLVIAIAQLLVDETQIKEIV